jgi:hypothetical protein
MVNGKASQHISMEEMEQETVPLTSSKSLGLFNLLGIIPRGLAQSYLLRLICPECNANFWLFIKLTHDAQPLTI